MSLQPIRSIRSRTIVLPVDNIDTDQIIPARFLKNAARGNLAAGLFAEWRADPVGKARLDMALNGLDIAQHRVLVAGDNFGCGSSREHAVWALGDFGFRAVISTSIADIFTANAVKNGLVPVTVDAATHQNLLSTAGAEVAIEIERSVIILPSGEERPFVLDSFARYCLLQGIDELDFLLKHKDDIVRFERRATNALTEKS